MRLRVLSLLIGLALLGGACAREIVVVAEDAVPIVEPRDAAPSADDVVAPADAAAAADRVQPDALPRDAEARDAPDLDARAADATGRDAESADAIEVDAGGPPVFDVEVSVDGSCDVTLDPTMIVVAAGTGFRVHWSHLAASASAVDIDEVEPFDQLRVVTGLAPGDDFRDPRPWCGQAFQQQFVFRVTGCNGYSDVLVDCR